MSIPEMNRLADASSVRCLNQKVEKEMVDIIRKAKKAGDSVGGIFEVLASGVPIGLGTHVHWERKLQARIAEAVMSINAIKGVELGLGFAYSRKFGSEVHDEIGFENRRYIHYSNNAGGIEGGMSNGETIVVRAIMKPIPTLIKPLKSVDIHSKERKDSHKERTDSCAVPAASIVGEAMLCLVLTDALLEAYGGDTVEQVKHRAKSVQHS
jgi:chorismate synthase